jgi:hypothetical protein
MNNHTTQLQPSGAGAIVGKADYARHIQVSKRTLDALLARGLPHLKLSNRLIRINVADADQWVSDQYRTQRRGGALVGAK